MGKKVVFCDKISRSNVNNFFLLEVGSSMIALFKANIYAISSDTPGNILFSIASRIAMQVTAIANQ